MKTEDIIEAIHCLSKSLDDESNIASDLWSYLPSHDFKKDVPSTYNVMKEACDYIYELQSKIEELKRSKDICDKCKLYFNSISI